MLSYNYGSTEQVFGIFSFILHEKNRERLNQQLRLMRICLTRVKKSRDVSDFVSERARKFAVKT